ncbi:hypothetical protein OAM66_00490 [Pelagibacteraceae bacterium]|nr:hypothetical protein [Pelagibacteraceae bacterium]
MFAFYNNHNNNLYNKLVELSRNIFFYKDIKLNDNFESRIMLIFMHLSIIMIITRKKFPQNIFDNIFLNIEYHLREIGHGDVSVNQKMKTLNKIFYDILLKIESKKNGEFTLNINIIKKYLYSDIKITSEISSKINDYFINFYNFCFVLDKENMIKGRINFKL